MLGDFFVVQERRGDTGMTDMAVNRLARLLALAGYVELSAAAYGLAEAINEQSQFRYRGWFDNMRREGLEGAPASLPMP